MPFLVKKGSSRAAALPAAPVAPMIKPVSFFSLQAVKKAARSMVRTRVLMPMAWRLLATASATEAYGGSGVGAPAAKPLEKPASLMRCFRRLGANDGGARGGA